MIDPAVALLVFGVLVLLARSPFWPKRGLVPWVLRLSEMSERVRLEDSLKHLYKCEYAGRPMLRGFGGRSSVGVSRSRALHLLGRLEELELRQGRG